MECVIGYFYHDGLDSAAYEAGTLCFEISVPGRAPQLGAHRSAAKVAGILALVLLALVGPVFSVAVAANFWGGGSWAPHYKVGVKMQLTSSASAYSTQYTQAMSGTGIGWNPKLTKPYFQNTPPPQAAGAFNVVAGSASDTQVSGITGFATCLWYLEHGLMNYRAFTVMGGVTIGDGCTTYQTTCLNNDARAPYKWYELSSTAKRRGFQHEWGHVLGLGHTSGVGTMNTCFCYDIQGDETSAIRNHYAW